MKKKLTTFFKVLLVEGINATKKIFGKEKSKLDTEQVRFIMTKDNRYIHSQ